MYREADVTAIEAAWTAHDADALATIGARLGIELALEQLAALFKRAGTHMRRRDVISTVLEAATYDAGIALFVTGRRLCLAVRAGDRVTAAVAPSEKPSKVWPELKPWQTEVARNRPRAEVWASTAATDRVVFSTVAVAPAAPLPDDADLVRQIVERPDDPGPREVLVDLWLQRDDVRGKLAKLDAEIAALPKGSDDRTKREVVRAVVVKQHGARIAGEVAAHAAAYALGRGFVENVTMTAAAFRDHGERLFAQQPIRRMILQPANTPAIATLVKGPVARLRELVIKNVERRTVDLAPLARAAFERLEVLEIWGTTIDDEATFAALAAPRLRMLILHAHACATTLYGLARNPAVCAALETLEITPVLSSVEERVPQEATIAEAAFDELALPRLRRLHVDGVWYFTAARVERLRARAPLLTDVLLT